LHLVQQTPTLKTVKTPKTLKIGMTPMKAQDKTAQHLVKLIMALLHVNLF
jgi:hypothetical protein